MPLRDPSGFLVNSLKNVVFATGIGVNYSIRIDFLSTLCYHKRVNREFLVSKPLPITLDVFVLFYEELTGVKPAKQRLRRPRVAAGANN